MKSPVIAIGDEGIWSLPPPVGRRRIGILVAIGDAAAGGGITITVANDIATTDVGGTDYTWPVAQGGAGAAAGTLDLSGSVALFTYSATNYQFPVSLSGAGGSTITVANNIASLAIDGTNVQWPVAPA